MVGLFTSREDKIRKYLNRYNLDELSEKDLISVCNIANELAGNNLIQFGTILSGKAEDVAKMGLLNALVEQNWMIINQLNRLNNKLDLLLFDENEEDAEFEAQDDAEEDGEYGDLTIPTDVVEYPETEPQKIIAHFRKAQNSNQILILLECYKKNFSPEDYDRYLAETKKLINLGRLYGDRTQDIIKYIATELNNN